MSQNIAEIFFGLVFSRGGWAGLKGGSRRGGKDRPDGSPHTWAQSDCKDFPSLYLHGHRRGSRDGVADQSAEPLVAAERALEGPPSRVHLEAAVGARVVAARGLPNNYVLLHTDGALVLDHLLLLGEGLGGGGGGGVRGDGDGEPNHRLDP